MFGVEGLKQFTGGRPAVARGGGTTRRAPPFVNPAGSALLCFRRSRIIHLLP